MARTLFVYGTLLRGERAHARLRAARYLGPARTAPSYRLVDLGAYPGLAAGAETVVGELYEVDDALLVDLDRYEDVPRSYVRTSIELADAGQAEAYLLVDGEAGSPLPGGDWRARDAARRQP